MNAADAARDGDERNGEGREQVRTTNELVERKRLPPEPERSSLLVDQDRHGPESRECAAERSVVEKRTADDAEEEKRQEEKDERDGRGDGDGEATDGGDEDEDEDTIPYPEPTDDEPLVHPPDFRPFFTLIEDPSGEHHHPRVHYVFADDDPEILTSAALASIATLHRRLDEVDEPNCERFVILDLSADGKAVAAASSLSSDWQDIKTKISSAPSWGGDHAGTAGERRLMLMICGQEIALDASVRSQRQQGGSLDSLLQAFDEQMNELESVIGNDRW